MTRLPLKSSNLKSVGYDSRTGTLEVEFHSGAVHQYHGVTADHHTKLLGAPSPGAYLSTHIKAQHRSTRVA